MYNGIGLQTVRGTGTSGHVQRNVAVLRGSARRGQRPRGPPPKSLHEAIRERVSGRLSLQPAFAAHESRRKVEVAVMELEEELIARGYEKNEIEQMKKRLREDLLARDEMEKEGEKDRDIVDERLQREEGRRKATTANEALIQRRNERMKEALGVGNEYQQGDFLRRMEEEKADKRKDAGAENEKIQDTEAGKHRQLTSNIVQLQSKDAPTTNANDTEELVNEGSQKPNKPPGDAVGELSGSESSVLTPSSPSSDSLPSQRNVREEQSDHVPPQSGAPIKQQRGGDVLLEEALKHVPAANRKRDDKRRPLSDTSGDPVERRPKPASPNSESFRDEPPARDGPQDGPAKKGGINDELSRGDGYRVEPRRDDRDSEHHARGGRSRPEPPRYNPQPARSDYVRNEPIRDGSTRNERCDDRPFIKDSRYNGTMERGQHESAKHDYYQDRQTRNRGYRGDFSREADYGGWSTGHRDSHDDKERERHYRDLADTREDSLSDSSESTFRRRRRTRMARREYSESPPRYRRPKEGKRYSRRGRGTRYSDEDDSYDSYSSDSRSPSPRRQRRSPSLQRGYSSRSVSPPRKRHRHDGYDAYARRFSPNHVHDAKEHDRFYRVSRHRSRSRGRSWSRSPRREYQRSMSPRRDSRQYDRRRQRWGNDPYESDDDFREGRAYRADRDRRHRYRSPSPKAGDTYRSPYADRYHSPPIDRDHDWDRNVNRDYPTDRDEHGEEFREDYDGRRTRRLRSFSRSRSPRRRSVSP